LVVEAAAPERLLAHLPRAPEAGAEEVDRVHAARGDDVVGGDERGVERARPRGAEELDDEARRVGVPAEDAVEPEVLRAHVRAEIRPLRLFGIGGRGWGGGGPRGR